MGGDCGSVAVGFESCNGDRNHIGDAWREREFRAGRIYDCASEAIGGYPFRLEWRCGAATLEFKGTPTLQLKLPVILAALQVYDPTLVVAEFSGPLDTSEPGRPPHYVAN